MGKKKNSNNSNTNKQEVEEAQQQNLSEAPSTKVVPKQSNSSSNGAESNGPTPAVTPTAPPVRERARQGDSNDSTMVTKQPYTIVPTPIEETSAQKVAGFFRRMENNERTEAEARAEEEHEERLTSLEGEEREIAVRSWTYRPSHVVLHVAFANKEKFERLYIEAEHDAFTFMVTTDMQTNKVAIVKAQRALRANIDGLVTAEMDSRSGIRKEGREAYSALIVDKDAQRRAVLAAEREARRQARQEALPEAPKDDGTEGAGTGTYDGTEDVPTADV